MIRIDDKYLIEEKVNCVNKYFEGISKSELAKEYMVSTRTIERWVVKYNVENRDIGKLKRTKVIPLNIQDEIYEILKENPLNYKFRISRWDTSGLKKLIWEKYSIDANMRMVTSILRSCKENAYYNSVRMNSDEVVDEIAKLDECGYKVILLDYIPLCKMEKWLLEIGYYGRFISDYVNVNIGIAREKNNFYLGRVNIEDNENKSRFGFSTKIEKAENNKLSNSNAKEKVDFIGKIIEMEKLDKVDIVFVVKEDKALKKIINKDKRIKFFIINEEVDLVQDEYEVVNDKEGMLLQYLAEEIEKTKGFDTGEDIDAFIQNVMGFYVGKDRWNKKIVKNIDFYSISKEK